MIIGSGRMASQILESGIVLGPMCRCTVDEPGTRVCTHEGSGYDFVWCYVVTRRRRGKQWVIGYTD